MQLTRSGCCGCCGGVLQFEERELDILHRHHAQVSVHARVLLHTARACQVVLLPCGAR